MGKASEIEQFVIDKVREIRLLKKYGQKQLSLEMGLSGKFVGNVESTKTDDKYNLNHLNKIAEILECSIKDFFPDEPFAGDLERIYPK
ncbi:MULTISPECIES: helix-turn-helix domain-containing protein [Pedobacter]|uniref:Helix-turn-helix domain-containing protein n=1 Tax=Pedobacter suwonensis TaxID=332999 RepID=A0A1I0TVU1_9SPHI|nr:MULTISPECIES: helix-turn-helix transcriptional regulator [Pedobacter]SFA55056.1 Helix-turn-helix domain-containing protein [Pedobacter suwonensis]